jgi:hypothetical protein
MCPVAFPTPPTEEFIAWVHGRCKRVIFWQSLSDSPSCLSLESMRLNYRLVHAMVLLHLFHITRESGKFERLFAVSDIP